MKRLFLRWLTRRSRIPPVLRLSAAVILGALALTGLAAPSSQGQSTTPSVAGGAARESNPPTKSPEPPGPGDPTKSFPDSPGLRALGISVLDDQAQAGAIMWVLGGVVMTAVGLWAAVAAMVAEERRMAAREARAVSVAGPNRGTPA